jgi:hypothetical protein
MLRVQFVLLRIAIRPCDSPNLEGKTNRIHKFAIYIGAGLLHVYLIQVHDGTWYVYKVLEYQVQLYSSSPLLCTMVVEVILEYR